MLRVKEWDLIYHGNSIQKRGGVAIMMTYKVNIKTKILTRIRGIFHNAKELIL
jgi:hypothetical protein